MAKQTIDKYSNMMVINLVESAANTLTFEQAPQVTTLMEKKAFLINRIEYNIPFPSRDLLVAAGDAIYYGMSLSDRWAAPLLTETTIVDFNALSIHFLTGVGFEYHPTSILKDFSTLPGGGLLLPTRPMFLYIVGESLAGPASIAARIFFTIQDLTPQDYWDLVEALQAYT